jgi:hypothetical protein
MSLIDRDPIGRALDLRATTGPGYTGGETALGATLVRSRSGLRTRHHSVVVTPTRLVVLPVSPGGRPTGPPVERVRREDVHHCSLWGSDPGEAGHWARHSRADHLVLETAWGIHRWSVLGGTVADEHLPEPLQQDGVEALYLWLVSTTPTRGRAPRSSAPGSSPVCSPSSKVTTPDLSV